MSLHAAPAKKESRKVSQCATRQRSTLRHSPRQCIPCCMVATGTASKSAAEAYATEVTRQPPCAIALCVHVVLVVWLRCKPTAPTSASLSDSIHPMYLMYSGFPKSVGYL